MNSDNDESEDTPAVLRNLTESQTERLTAVLDRYLGALESGQPPDLKTLLKENDDLREPLEIYLGKLGELHNFAAGFSPQLSDAQNDLLDQSRTSLAASGQDAANESRSRLGSANSDGSESEPPLHLLDGDLDADSSASQTRRLGDFELIRVIGRGGMGIVYEAQQISLRRRVALKLLPLISVLDARQITRFKNEAQAAAALQHPNIVPAYAVGSYKGIHYYAMRLIDGYPVDAILSALRGDANLQAPSEREQQSALSDTKLASDNISSSSHASEAAAGWKKPTDVKRVVTLGIEAASALSAAHVEGIVHRDIKPSNLMIDKQGKLWITDFGLARRVNDHTLTASGDLLGTLRYMSPEQAKAEAALIDGRSDIYSLGVTLYEMLTLQPAIMGESSPSMLRAIEEQTPVPLRQLRPDIPRDLVTVLETAMAKNREDRYLTAELFAEDLRRVLEGRPTLAKPPTVVVRAAKWALRHHRLVTAVSLALIVAALGLGISTWIIAAKNAYAVRKAASAERAWNQFRSSLTASMQRPHEY